MKVECNSSATSKEHIKKYMKSLINKYFLKYDEELLEEMYKKTMIINKYSRLSIVFLYQLAAVVVYS